MTDRERAGEMWASGRSAAFIARELGIGTTTVRRWVYPAYAEEERARSRAWKAAHREGNRERDRRRRLGVAVRGPSPFDVLTGGER